MARGDDTGVRVNTRWKQKTKGRFLHFPVLLGDAGGAGPRLGRGGLWDGRRLWPMGHGGLRGRPLPGPSLKSHIALCHLSVLAWSAEREALRRCPELEGVTADAEGLVRCSCRPRAWAPCEAGAGVEAQDCPSHGRGGDCLPLSQLPSVSGVTTELALPCPLSSLSPVLGTLWPGP